jgi:hypothetical protein
VRLKPLSKSTYKNFLLCPWVAHQFKNLGIVSEGSDAATAGIETHSVVADVLLGKYTQNQIDIFAPSEEVALLAKTILTLFPPPDAKMIIEARMLVDAFGEATDIRSQAILHGFMDLAWRESVEKVRVRDWKTGKWEKADIDESNLYALLGRAMFPGSSEVDFELCYPKSGNIIKTSYKWVDDNKTCIITSPDGDENELYSDYDPILEYWHTRIKQIEDTPCVPTPGSHCTRWYGRPCQFLGKGCPLNDVDPRETANLPAEFQSPEYGKALASIIRGDVISPTVASTGLYAIQRMKEFLRQAEGRIQDWSKDNGSIKIGDSSYGWKNRVVYDVDSEFVINTLINSDIPMSDWPISITKTSISKMPKKKYKTTRELLESFAVYPKESKPQFGLLKEEVE